MNRILLLALHTGSLVLLGFGWFLDMLKIDINAHFIVDISLFNEKRSVLGTLQTLWENGNWFPFSLILLFGIIVPLLKTGAIYYVLIARQPRQEWTRFINMISKWAMADVFAISIIMAFLGAKAMQNTSATLEPGFYWFAAYVLVSGLISFFVGKMMGNFNGKV